MADEKSIWKKEIHLRRKGGPPQATPPAKDAADLDLEEGDPPAQASAVRDGSRSRCSSSPEPTWSNGPRRVFDQLSRPT